MLARILKPAGTGESVAVGTPILVTVDDVKDVAAFANFSAGASAGAPQATAAAVAAPLAAAHAGRRPSIAFRHGKRAAAHAASASAAAAAPKAAAVAAAVPPPPAAPAAAAPRAPRGESPARTFRDAKPSTIRRVIAARLTESKATTPHAYATVDVHIDALLALRGKLKEAGVIASVNDMVVAACGRALRAVPEANAFFDAAQGRVVRSPGVDVSVAVATEGGLITPIVKGADGLSLGAINERVKDLAGRARANKLKPEEFQGGTFTISNLGMFDAIDEFSAVINPPQACILAVGKGAKRVLPPAAKGDQPAVATVMALQLSADARVVEPFIAGQFLQALRQLLENPVSLL